MQYIGGPVKFSEDASTIRMRAPRLGEHTLDILQELGYNDNEISALHEEGAPGFFDYSVFMKQEADMRKILKLFMTFVFACCLFVGVNPAEAGLISREQEIEMGQQTAQQLETQYGVSQDAALQERVNRNRPKTGEGLRT